MAICLKHNQCYNPKNGEYCPYCGVPERKKKKPQWVDASKPRRKK